MPFSIMASVDRYVSKLEEPREPDQKHHPSSLFGCARKAVYEFNGVEKSNPTDARGLRIFRLGHLFHEFVQEALADDPEIVQFWPEVKLYDPVLNITGHADGIALTQSGRWVVIELKSIGSYGFKKKDLPQTDHKLQAATYAMTIRDYGFTYEELPRRDGRAYEVQHPPIPELRSLRFAYVNKETGEIAEFDVQVTPPKEAEVRARVAQIDSHVKAGTLPDRLPLEPSKKKADNGRLVKNWACGYCPFATTCWEDA